MNNKLTESQAFKAMVKFLIRYYEETQSDDVGSLLGELQILSDGETADPAAWDDWLECVEQTIQEEKASTQGKSIGH